MGFRITTNIASVNGQRNLSNSQRDIQDSYAKLSSGSRINKAADDAAGSGHFRKQFKAEIRSARQKQTATPTTVFPWCKRLKVV